MRALARWMIVGLAFVAGGAGAASRTVRVGLLVDVPEVAVGARARDLVLKAGDDDRARQVTGVLRFAVRPGEPGAVATVDKYAVRVRSEKDRRKAELVEKGLREALKVPLHVERNGGGFAILAGPFDSQKRARELADQLHAAGMAEATVVALESGADAAPKGPRLVVVTGAFDVLDVAGGRARVIPANGQPLEVDGRLYRGEIEVAAGAGGTLSVVDVVGLEDYLRGVVPEEMGPELYPMPAALEAQAIAARSYVLRASQHESQGFDACTTAHCQVYGGASSEHPLSDAAVARTAGMVLEYQGEPALTYFSSTCGGHTEDAANVFDGPAQEYLRGVPCYPEQVTFQRIPGRRVVSDWELVSGPPADEVLARLVAVGVVTDEQAQAAGFTRRATRDEAVEWLRRAALSCGASLKPEQLSAISVDTVMTFVASLVSALGWEEQRRLISEQDLAAAARFRVLQGLSSEELTDGLIAMKAGILPLGYQPGWATSKISRGNVLEIVALWVGSRGRFDVSPARFVGLDSRGLRVLAGKEVQSLPIGTAPIVLAGRRGTAPRLREALDLKVGDKLWIQKDGAGAAALVALEDDPDGAAFDRLSAYSWWSRRITAEQLQAVAKKVGLSALKDVRVTRVSPGGRIVGIDLVGPDATKSVAGFAVREVLGVPDLRGTLQVERDGSGRLVAAVVTGRGWGHGVGLCQTGAHGMALAGASSSDVLLHYYPGTTLSRKE